MPERTEKIFCGVAFPHRKFEGAFDLLLNLEILQANAIPDPKYPSQMSVPVALLTSQAGKPYLVIDEYRKRAMIRAEEDRITALSQDEQAARRPEIESGDIPF